jgi:hypothetical protein
MREQKERKIEWINHLKQNIANGKGWEASDYVKKQKIEAEKLV